MKAAPVRLAVISEGLNTWPLYVAQAQGLFEREGIAVETTITGSSVHQLDSLIAGRFDVGFQQSDHVVRGVERGSDLFIFMAQAHAPDLTLVCAPEVTRMADLRGRRIAVDGARTGYALLLRKWLADHGLNEGDYKLDEIGGSRERFESLQSGTACASLLNPPFDRNLLAAGFRSLGTTNQYFPDYPGSIAAARRSWAQANEAGLVAFIRAFDAGYRWLQEKANKPAAIAMLPSRLEIEPEAAGRAFDMLATRPRPAIDLRALEPVIELVWASDGFIGARPAPDKYFDLGYLAIATGHHAAH